MIEMWHFQLLDATTCLGKEKKTINHKNTFSNSSSYYSRQGRFVSLMEKASKTKQTSKKRGCTTCSSTVTLPVVVNEPKKKKKEAVWCHIKQVLIIFGSKLPFLNVFGSHLKTTIQKDNNHLSLGKSLIRFSTENFAYFFNIFWRQILFQQQNHLQTKTTHKRVDSYRMGYNPMAIKANSLTTLTHLS